MFEFQTTTPVQVIYRAPWSRPDADDPIKFRSGAAVEFVKLLDPATGETMDVTLGESINGEVRQGESYFFLMRMRSEIVAAPNGRTRPKQKFTIVEAHAAKPQAVANGQAKVA